jgi:hypothetical protein
VPGVIEAAFYDMRENIMSSENEMNSMLKPCGMYEEEKIHQWPCEMM